MRRAWPARFVWLLPLVVGLGLTPRLWSDERPQGEVRTYLSAVDGSRQAYGLYLPRANAPTERGFPVVFHAHGYGWYAGADFSPWQRGWADDHGWVLVNVNGRGPNFYDGIGDDDALRVLEDVAGLIAVDRTRVFVTGGSMGGTGAYRLGVRRPDVFAASAPVDGWTDYRLFHKHWYERKDMPGTIEEFRRPLLEATSATFAAGTARWTDLQLVTDGRDTIVDPDEGLRLNQALHAERVGAPDAYRHELILNRDLGHCGGYDLPRIYEHFLGVSGPECPPAVTVQTTLLRCGAVHWAHLDRFRVQGGPARLDVEVVKSAAQAVTQNLDGFGLALADSPLRDRDRIQVVADGFPCYDGPPADVSFTALRDEFDRVIGWTLASSEAPRLTKRRGLEGPIGEAFVEPFVVLWGTGGDASAAQSARAEAEDFANEWNGFNVHYAAVRARPEDEVTEEELQSKNLILFGDLDGSALLRRVDGAAALPVRVYRDRVVVRDPANGDRAYLGGKYGAYWVYPNPLSGFRTFVVGLKGRFVTTAAGRTRRGLGYDLETLPWAWGDYVVFDADPADLPYVGNVNNKDSTLCYEAGYFVEAGFFDQDWRADRSVELGRVRALRPEGSRLVHLDSVTPVAEGVRVRVVDEGGGPVRAARVTLGWSGAAEETSSRPTDNDGVAVFRRPGACSDRDKLRAQVVNVCATAGTYSWPDDRERSATCGPGGAPEIALLVSPSEADLLEGGCASFVVRLGNEGDRPVRVTLAAPAAPGVVAPLSQELSAAAGHTAEARFVWDAGGLPPGAYSLPLTVAVQGEGPDRVVRTAWARFTVSPVRKLLAEVSGIDAADRPIGGGWEIVARLRNNDAAAPAALTASCVLVEARRYLPTQKVRLAPSGTVEVRWRQDPSPGLLPLGIYTVRVSLAELPGVVGEASFVVK